MVYKATMECATGDISGNVCYDCPTYPLCYMIETSHYTSNQNVDVGTVISNLRVEIHTNTQIMNCFTH
jgi:hypothetical protein